MDIVTAREALQLPERTPASARTVFRLLQQLRHGSLTISLPDGSVQTVGDGQGPHLSLHLHNWQPFKAALKSGDIGFAESYIAGDWTTSHLPDLLRLLAANRQALDDVIHGSWIGRLAYRLRHLLNRNTRGNSRKNIHAHYDLGNDFYRLWLDGTMNYSSGLFQGNLQQDMQQAQHAKVRRALHMAGVRRGHRVLEIGCGWGALAEKATQEFGAHLTGVTLSTEQLAWAKARLENKGLGQQADFRLQDYRDCDGQFDHIASIEMFEAVGEEYWSTYFQAVNRLLKPGGRAAIQTITIDDALFERYRKGTDFIQQYIFPGGMLPCPSKFRALAEKHGLRVVSEKRFGKDYAETLRRWRKTFMSQLDTVRKQGFDQPFINTWEFYLAYCEAGFEYESTDVFQFYLEKNR